MAKFLRTRTRSGWTTKPAADEPLNKLLPLEVDETMLELEAQQAPVGSVALELKTAPVRDGWTVASGSTGGQALTVPNFGVTVGADTDWKVVDVDISEDGKFFSITHSVSSLMFRVRIYNSDTGAGTNLPIVQSNGPGLFIGDTHNLARTGVTSGQDVDVYDANTTSIVESWVGDYRNLGREGKLYNAKLGTWYYCALNDLAEADVSTLADPTIIDTITASHIHHETLNDGALLVINTLSSGGIQKYFMDTGETGVELLNTDMVPGVSVRFLAADARGNLFFARRTDTPFTVYTIDLDSHEVLNQWDPPKSVTWGLVSDDRSILICQNTDNNISFLNVASGESVLPEFIVTDVEFYDGFKIHPITRDIYVWGFTGNQSVVNDLVQRLSMPEFRPDLSAESPHVDFEYRYKYRHSGVPD